MVSVSKLQRSVNKRQKERRSGGIGVAPQDWQPWQLLPGPQTQAGETQAFETLFGGRAGGGKSACLLALAATQHRSSVVFRRVYPNLKEMIMKAREMFQGSGARYNGTDKIWQDIPGGRTLEFGAVQYLDSVYHWRGRAHDLKAFDELTEFEEFQYEFLSGWTRTHIPGQRCRVIGTCNPPSNREGLWVKHRWAPWVNPKYRGKKAEPGEIRWFARLPSVVDGEAKNEAEIMAFVPEGTLLLRKISHSGQYEFEVPSGTPFNFETSTGIETIEPSSRTFIPATLADNPFIDASYRRTLMAMPEPLRSQLLYGDFSIEPESGDEFQLIPTSWVHLAQARWSPNPPTPEQTAIGVDVARGGADSTAIACAHYLWIDRIQVYPGASVPSGADSAGHVVHSMKSNDVALYVDTVGVGASCYDFLIEWGHNAYSCMAGAGSTRKARNAPLTFANKRSEWAWNLRELFDPDNNYPIAIPPDDQELEEELCEVRWNGKGRSIVVEPREELLKSDRLGRSPDRFSALMLALSAFTE